MSGNYDRMQTPTDANAPLSLLLIDDDAELCGMMREFFTEMGCQLDCAYNGRDGLVRTLDNSYDLVILDVMLPVVNGFTVLQQLRRRKDVPVIMLTARVQPQDRISGLHIGADDYLVKPFDPDELLARICAVLRRTGRLEPGNRHLLKFGGIEIDIKARNVTRSGQLLDLTSLEFDILELLIRADGRIVPRDEIMVALFERQATPYDRSLDVHVSHLRKKLERAGALIRTIRGIGYLFTRDSDATT